MAVHYAAVLGFAYESPTVEFPVRTGPGTNFDMAPFKVNKGTTNLEVLAIQPDSQGTTSDLGRVYNWMQMKFPNGQIGWMRGHVIGLVGDYTDYGYGVLPNLVHEYKLTRNPAAATNVTSPALEAVKTAKDAQTQQQELAKLAQQPAAPAQPAPAAPAPATPAQPAPAAPATPAAPAPAPAAQGTWAPVRPTTPAMARIMMQSAARFRDAPSTNSNTIGSIPRGTTVPILAVRDDANGMYHRWLQLNFNGQVGWVREDLVSVEGDSEALGLPWDVYPAPMGANRWWVRGWNMPPRLDPNAVGGQHDGWDHGAPDGDPVLCGPAGGLVVKINDCTRCTPAAPSTVMQGLGLANPSVFQDPAWGFGYGTFVIVGYSNDKLPNSTRSLLAQRGYPGGALFVMYAHLKNRAVAEGQALTANQPVGGCGNTGNSEATHLHLEVRASQTFQFTSWANIRPGVMDPIVLFRR